MGFIEHFTDNDLYKYAMQNAVIQKYPRAIVKYKFIDRGNTEYPEGFAKALWPKIQFMANLSLHYEEKDFLLERCSYLSPPYVEFLKAYRYRPSEIQMTQKEGKLDIVIQGPWYRTILWEVPLLALISETYFDMTGQKLKFNDAALTKTNEEKAAIIKVNEMDVAEFGTRRRFSYTFQKQTVRELSKNLVGTSNVFLAKENNLKAIGTQAHEWYMFHATKYGYPSANYMGMKKWVSVYEGQLGIALTDTFTTEQFLLSFGKRFARLFDGVRHDSGDPFEFYQTMIKHYMDMGIDPGSKDIVFSDGLTIPVAAKLKQRVGNLFHTSYGIGTALSNDVPGVKPLNIVIKMSDVLGRNGRWQPTVKLSDVVGKHTGTPEAIEICQKLLNF